MTVAELLGSLLQGNVAPGAYHTDEGINVTACRGLICLDYWDDQEFWLLDAPVALGDQIVGNKTAQLVPLFGG
jgi:hypothetical protein